MKNYVYYSEGTNDNGQDDVALTEAASHAEAIAIFKKYYNNVEASMVKEVDYYREGYVQGIMIVSKY